MISLTNDFDKTLQNALRSEKAVWTRQCIEPETLLDWVRQGDAHPEAMALFEHLLDCAYCQQERAAVQEVLALQRDASLAAVGIPDVRTLPGKIRDWVYELIEGGVAPIRSLRPSLAAFAKSDPLPVLRDGDTPTDLRPSAVAVRTTRPVLHWSEAASASHEVLVGRLGASKGREILWRGVAETPGQLLVSDDAGLEPGGVYEWQVIARIGQEESPSVVARFVVLPERTRRQVETLERRIGNVPLARIGLYEAHGLFEDALEQAETLVRLNPDEATAHAIYAKLREKLPM